MNLLREAAARLAAAGIDNPLFEARLLLAHANGIATAAVLPDATPTDRPRFDALLARRLAHEPIARITGHQGFWTLDLAVNAATLIPRADSETLIEAAGSAFPNRSHVRRILDLGTGTGCLLLAALVEFPQAWGLGIDISPDAAAQAAANARTAGLADRAAFAVADWAAPLRTRFDLVLSNPPYIESAAIPRLMPEVADHEPRRALDGGPDGLEAYRRIATALRQLLAPGGVGVLELGQGQAPDVTDIARQAGLNPIETRPDLGGIPRALVLAIAGS